MNTQDQFVKGPLRTVLFAVTALLGLGILGTVLGLMVFKSKAMVSILTIPLTAGFGGIYLSILFGHKSLEKLSWPRVWIIWIGIFFVMAGLSSLILTG